MFVEVTRKAKTAPDLATGAMGGVHRFSHEGATQRDERDHIGDAGARVLALVAAEVDQLGCLRGASNSGFHNGVGGSREGHHGAIVIGIGFPAKQKDTRRGFNGIHDRPYHALIAAFRKVRDAL